MIKLKDKSGKSLEVPLRNYLEVVLPQNTFRVVDNDFITCVNNPLFDDNGKSVIKDIKFATKQELIDLCRDYEYRYNESDSKFDLFSIIKNNRLAGVRLGNDIQATGK